MKLFLQDIKILQESCEKNCKIIFLRDLINILQENYLKFLSCKILARFFVSCKKSYTFLVQDLQDLVQDLASLVRKIFAKLAYFLQDFFY